MSIFTDLRYAFYLVLLLCAVPAAQAGNDFAQLRSTAQQHFQAGRYAEAISHWEQAHPQAPADQKIGILLNLALAYQHLGEHPKVLQQLSQALALAGQSGDSALLARVLGQSADAWMVAGDVNKALQLADRSVAVARAGEDAQVLALSLNNLGNVLAVSGYDDTAREYYAESMALSAKADNGLLYTKTALNHLKTLLYTAETEVLLQAAARARAGLAGLADNRDSAALLLTFGSLMKYLLNDPALTAVQTRQTLADAHAAFQRAVRIGQETGEHRTTSLAYGRLAELYERGQRYDEALALNRQALFYAGQGEYPDIRYLWEWQQGRLLEAQGQHEAAIAAHRKATETLEPIRYMLNTGYRMAEQSFDDAVRPVYYHHADLLLRHAARHPERRQALLAQAIEAVEKLKHAELQNYFRDECVAAYETRQDALQLPAGTAILYPIPLADRLVLILRIGDTLEATNVVVDHVSLNDTLLELRGYLQIRPENRFLSSAQTLYQWLIAPVLPQLRQAKIDTLVFVPDGRMRMVPLGTLHNGEGFLIEEFALAVAPSLAMLETRVDPDWVKQGMLLVGLSKSVQGYPALPGVSGELSQIQTTVGSEDKLLNESYTSQNFEARLRAEQYAVVHMATHGEFSPDPDQTYLLSFSDKLKMDKLEQIIGLGRFREQPLELLTLSACRTAVGDDRAALGLAGVAVKAGARSAIASLWFVDDEVTSLAMRGFYQEIVANPGLSKAKALQRVQKRLISQQRYWHPSYWAPYLLIGNWL